MDTNTLPRSVDMTPSFETVNFDVRGLSKAERDASRPERMQAFYAFIMSKSDVFVDTPYVGDVSALQKGTALKDAQVDQSPNAPELIDDYESDVYESDVIEGEFDDDSEVVSSELDDSISSGQLAILLNGTDMLVDAPRKIEAWKPIDPLLINLKSENRIVADNDTDQTLETPLVDLSKLSNVTTAYLKDRPEVTKRLRNVLADEVRDALIFTKEAYKALFTSRKPIAHYARLGIAVATGLNIATVLQSHIHLNEIKRPSVVAEAPINTIAIGPLPTNPSELEVTPTTEAETPETTDVTETSVEGTQTTEETPETTIDERSPYERYNAGEIDKTALEAVKIGEVTIDSICMEGIDLYGDNRRSTNDKALLDYYLSIGSISAVEYDTLLAGKAPYEVEAKFQALYDTIFKVEPAQLAQDETCVLPNVATEYPARYESVLKVPQSTSMERLSDIEPVADVNLGGALPGEEGIVVVSGHRTTYSAPFKNLDRLVSGDEIKISTDDGKEFTYIVEALRIVSVEDYSDLLLTPSISGSRYALRVTTCDDGSKDRLIVDAYLVGTEA